MISITIPFPPSANNLFKNAGSRGRAKTDDYKAWIEVAGWALVACKPGPGIRGPVTLDIMCERKDKRRRDISNLIKATEDLLVRHGLIEDDSKVADLRIRWGNVTGCVVTISSAEELAA